MQVRSSFKMRIIHCAALTMADAAISAYWLPVEEASAHVQMAWNYYLETGLAVTVMELDVSFA